MNEGVCVPDLGSGEAYKRTARVGNRLHRAVVGMKANPIDTKAVNERRNVFGKASILM